MTTPKPHIAQTLLNNAHSPTQATTLFTTRVQHKPLFLHPTTSSTSTTNDTRTRRRQHRLRKKEYFHRKQKPRPLSAREKRLSGAHKLPKDECRFEVFEGLHRMWVGYMQEVLNLNLGAEKGKGNGKGVVVTPAVHGSKLVSADMHGAMVEVVRSRCASRVGTKGIVVRDTKFTFLVVAPGDRVTSIPKEHTVFRFTVPLPGEDVEDAENEARKELVFELHGSQFQNRAVDRANKKFKWRNVDYL